MIRFESDYTQGAHPSIIKALADTNLEQTKGYGEDEYCKRAADYIKKHCECPQADVHFLVGGTQTNLTVIDAVLKPYQGVICASSGHINVHETGAVEATGHKVLAIGETNGKITAANVAQLCEEHAADDSFEHTVQPGMVYISNPTEYGTLYTKNELEELSNVCKSFGLTLFLDGARLGYGLMAQGNDLFLRDIAQLCDVFYIGGTKVGALFGEALVITNKSIQKDFRYMIKQKGAMLAKGRLLGIQFEKLFEDRLYFEISEHADVLAMKIKQAFTDKGISLAYDSPTNQQFPILTYEQAMKLSEKYSFTMNIAELKKHKSQVRFCTSFATTESEVLELIEDINKL